MIRKLPQPQAGSRNFKDAIFLLRWRGRGASSKSECVCSGRKSEENSFSSPSTRASSRKARSDISPVVSKRRRLPRVMPERSASSACVMFSASRRAFALTASSRWVSDVVQSLITDLFSNFCSASYQL